jgi:hypothetical protein
MKLFIGDLSIILNEEGREKIFTFRPSRQWKMAMRESATMQMLRWMAE